VRDALRELEAQFAELAEERDAQREQAARRHADERATWQAERVQLLQQLVHEATTQASLSTALEQLHEDNSRLKDQLEAAQLAGDAAVRRQLHDAERHGAQLSEAQEALRVALARRDLLQEQCAALRQDLDDLAADTAGTRMASALAVDQLQAEIETLQHAARTPAPAVTRPEPELSVAPTGVPTPAELLPPKPEAALPEVFHRPGAVAVDVLPAEETVRRGVLTGRRRR
jgi:chromosome segregation ATPase